MTLNRIPLCIAASLILGLLWISPVSCSAPTDSQPLATTLIAAPEQPVISADRTSYNESTGRHTLTGNVRITIGDRCILTNHAKINSQTMQIWTDGHTTLLEGELRFTGDALYAELSSTTAWFFGVRCNLTRPGLVIHADSMSYDWTTHIATFDGHVYCTQNGHNTTSSHLEFNLEKDAIVG